MKGFFHVAAPFVLDGISMGGNIYGDVRGIHKRTEQGATGVIHAGIWRAYTPEDGETITPARGRIA